MILILINVVMNHTEFELDRKRIDQDTKKNHMTLLNAAVTLKCHQGHCELSTILQSLMFLTFND